MKKIFKNNYNRYLKIIILTLIFFLGFSVTLNITDFILGTELQQMFLSIVGNKIEFLVLFYLIDSIIVSSALNFLTPKIERKCFINQY